MASLAIFASVSVTLLTGAVVTALPPSDLRIELPSAAAPVPPAIAAPARLAPAPPAERAKPRDSWRIQVGAFATGGAAEARLRALSAQISALTDLEPSIEPAGRLSRARFGGLRDEAQAAALCARIAQTGSNCFVVPPRP